MGNGCGNVLRLLPVIEANDRHPYRRTRREASIRCHDDDGTRQRTMVTIECVVFGWLFVHSCNGRRRFVTDVINRVPYRFTKNPRKDPAEYPPQKIPQNGQWRI